MFQTGDRFDFGQGLVCASGQMSAELIASLTTVFGERCEIQAEFQVKSRGGIYVAGVVAVVASLLPDVEIRYSLGTRRYAREVVRGNPAVRTTMLDEAPVAVAMGNGDSFTGSKNINNGVIGAGLGTYIKRDAGLSCFGAGC